VEVKERLELTADSRTSANGRRFIVDYKATDKRIVPPGSLWWSALLKLSALEEWAFPLITGLSTMLRAYTFCFLLRTKTFPQASRAHVAYLYIVGAALFFPHLAAAATGSLFDFADRYQWIWYPGLEVGIFGLIWIWSLLRLRLSAKMLVGIVHEGSSHARKLETQIANRLIISQAVSFVAISCLLAALGFPILHMVLKVQGA
jgi:hypothetical protein